MKTQIINTMKRNSIKGLLLITLGLITSFTIHAQTGVMSHGLGAGANNTTGDYNTFVGDSAGYNTTVSKYNSFFGYKAGYSDVGTFRNTFVGFEAGLSNIDGDDNTFIGKSAGTNNIASDNTFIGSDAGRQNTTGYRNTFIGTDAGYDNTTGHHNFCLGDSAGTDNSDGTYNVFIGAASGAASEHANFNTFIGAYSGFDNNRTNNSNVANRNTYIGYRCGYTNYQGEDNVFIGHKADFGYNNGSNMRNVVIGSNAIMGSGGNNVVLIGAESYVNKDDVTAVGYKNMVGGARSVSLGAYDTITATDAVCIGYDAKISGNYSIGIGRETEITNSNAIAIGYQAAVSSNNEVSIGNSTSTTIGGYVNWSATSDARVKTNIEENVKGLNFIDALRPVTYNYDVATLEAFFGREIPEGLQQAARQKSTRQYSGFIAQEVEDAAKRLKYDFSGIKAPTNDKDLYALRYAEFVVPLVKATQELHQKVKDQEALISQQQQIMAKYENAFNEMNSRMEILEAKVEQQEAGKLYSVNK